MVVDNIILPSKYIHLFVSRLLQKKKYFSSFSPRQRGAPRFRPFWVAIGDHHAKTFYLPAGRPQNPLKALLAGVATGKSRSEN